MNCISYVTHTTHFTGGIPTHIQRLLLNSYCADNDFKVIFEQLEIEVMPHLPTLQQVIETANTNGVVLFSTYSLPEEPELRAHILDLALSHGVPLYFANELEELRTPEDRARIDRILSFGSIAA